MTPNPYAPPKSEVADVVGDRVAPALWNPNAAASWSLLLSPAFGAFLHMKNWQALGESGKAAKAKLWVIASLAILVGVALVSAFLPDSKAFDGLSRIASVALLLSWYYTSGKPQVGYILSRYGNSYPRRGWGRPLVFAVVTIVCLVGVVVAVAVAASTFTGEV